MLRLASSALLLAVLAAPLHAQPIGDPGGVIEVHGATFAEFEDQSGVLTLRGTPVVVRRGAMVLRAPSIIYETKARTIRAAGGASYRDADLSLEAATVTLWLNDERLAADGGVAASQGQGAEAIRLRAPRLEVLGRDRRFVATGGVEMIVQDVTLTGDRIEAALARDELVADGNARVVRADIEGRAPRVLIRRHDTTAVLSGGAVVRQGASEARTETITLDLRRRRFTAAGSAVLILHPAR